MKTEKKWNELMPNNGFSGYVFRFLIQRFAGLSQVWGSSALKIMRDPKSATHYA
jgi:hypothetical protein